MGLDTLNELTKQVTCSGSNLSPADITQWQERINAAVFPGLQGGPHNQSITAGTSGYAHGRWVVNLGLNQAYGCLSSMVD